jgi:Tol biopolymer transport system component
MRGDLLHPEYEANPWISPDGNMLLFDSDRPGGHGGRDLWSSRKTRDGWSEPVNLGPTVNSAKDETHAFVTQDGKTLYFAGDSRTGDGDHVIYACDRSDGGGWGRPRVVVAHRVGEPTLTADGKRMYFVHIYKMPGEAYNADILYTERE